MEQLRRLYKARERQLKYISIFIFVTVIGLQWIMVMDVFTEEDLPSSVQQHEEPHKLLLDISITQLAKF